MKKKAILLVLMMVLMLFVTACASGGGRDRGKDRETRRDDVEDTELEEDEDDEDEDDEDEVEDDEKVTEKTPATAPSELSDDIYSFQVSVDGTVYQFPMWAKDFAALGWTYDGDDSQTLTSNQYTVAETWVKGDLEVYTSLINLSMNEVTFKDAAVGGITFDEYDGSMYYNMTYEYDYYQEIDLYVYKESGTLDKIEIRNFVELEGADNSVNPAVPDVVKEYKAPSELGNDLYAFNIQLEGKLYTLPCPVSALVANGFKIVEDNSQMEIGADSYGWIELSYNNQTYRCIVDNYANYATIPDNCFLTTMESSIYGPEFDLVIPGNIKVGDAEADVVEIIKNFNYEAETSGDFTYYEITDSNGSALAEYELTVKEGKVISIDVQFDD